MPADTTDGTSDGRTPAEPVIFIPPEAVRLAMAARADALRDRPDLMVLSDERLTGLMLAAAAPLIAAAERERLRQLAARVDAVYPDLDAPGLTLSFARLIGDPAAPAAGCDIEASADALEEAAIRLHELLAAFTASGWRSLDPRAVFLGMARACEPVESAARELARQGWLDLDDADENDQARWAAALAGLRDAAAMFEEIADGWI